MIKTKLLKPDTTAGIVPRQRLLEVFAKAKNVNLILVVAPAGFGKSIAISQWLDYKNETYGWISLDENDNEIQSFLSYIVASITSVYPNVNLTSEQLILNTDNPGLDIISDSLLNDLDKINDNITLVLDDYHLITNTSIHQLVNRIIHYVRSNIKFIVASRNTPPFRLAKIRMHARMAEITNYDLQFTSDEFNDLLKQKSIRDLTDLKKENLLEYTDGWVVGLNLIINNLKSHGELFNGIEGVKYAKEQIFDIFMEDVFNRQESSIQQQLVLSAHLVHFSAELVNCISAACFENTDVHRKRIDFVRFLQRNNMFLVEIGTDNDWFRYHHLFKEFLLNRATYVLDEAMLNCFLNTVATWYDNNGFIEEALRFALKLNTNLKALEIFARHRDDLVNTEQFSLLLQCLQLFPPGIIDNEPLLVLSRAQLAISKANYTDMVSDLSIAQELLINDHNNKALMGEIYALTACMKILSNKVKESLDFSTLALQNLPTKPGYMRDFSNAFRAMATFSEYSVKESIKLIDDEQANLTSYNVYGTTRLLAIKSLILSINADYESLKQTSLGYLKLSKESNLMMSWVMSNYFLGTFYYKKNQLSAAKKHFEAVIEANFFGRPVWNLFCSKNYLDTLVALGELDACLIHISEIELWVAERKEPGLMELLKMIKTEFAISIGDIEKAKGLAEHFGLTKHDYFPFYSYFPQLTIQKVRLFDNDHNKWEIASIELDQIVKHAREKSFNSLLTEALALKAVYYQQIGNIYKAKECIIESLAAIKSGSNIRTYIDLGARLSTTILAFTALESSNKLLQEIVVLFKNIEGHQEPLDSKKSKKESRLSQREIEIIRLIAQGMRNSEISEVLHISEDTVKKHLYNAYKKLGVRNRIGAVQQAEKLNIL